MTRLGIIGSGAIGTQVARLAVAAGTLAESWKFEPESGAYTSIYAADAAAYAKDYLSDAGAPLPADRLRERLAASHRPDVANRAF